MNRIRICTYDEMVSSRQGGREVCDVKCEVIKHYAQKFNMFVVVWKNCFLVGGDGVCCINPLALEMDI